MVGKEKRMKNNIAKRLLTVALSAAMVLTCVPAMTFAAENDSSSGTEADATVSENKKYIDFSLGEITTDQAAGKKYFTKFVETSGGTIVQENGKYYLEIEYRAGDYTKNKNTEAIVDDSVWTNGYFNATVDGTEYDLFENKDDTRDVLARGATKSNPTEDYYKIAKGRIPLDISSPEEAKGIVLQIKYNPMSAKKKYNEKVEITLGNISETRKYTPTITVNKNTVHTVWDGRYGANYDVMDEGSSNSMPGLSDQ